VASHGSGLGTSRWVVEQSFALLHWFRRLRICWEIRDDIHEALLELGCDLISCVASTAQIVRSTKSIDSRPGRGRATAGGRVLGVCPPVLRLRPLESEYFRTSDVARLQRFTKLGEGDA
jgi:hypothetical protein